MTSIRHVRVINNCTEAITFFFRHRRPMKGRAPTLLISPVTLQPAEESVPLPYHALVGARGWAELSRRECVQLVTVDFVPRFVTLTNLTPDTVVAEVRPVVAHPRREVRPLELRPRKESRIVDLASISRRGKIGQYLRDGNLKTSLVEAIGPSTGARGAVASFSGESVYICYECGGPIIFRGSPPVPIHI